jgi:hypothetical protein
VNLPHIQGGVSFLGSLDYVKALTEREKKTKERKKEKRRRKGEFCSK